jgi:hypothetical protein
MRRENIHLTLAFLGTTDAALLPVLGECARGLRFAPLALALARVGYWKHQRIIWCGPEVEPQALSALVAELRAAGDLLRPQAFRLACDAPAQSERAGSHAGRIQTVDAQGAVAHTIHNGPNAPPAEMCGASLSIEVTLLDLDQPPANGFEHQIGNVAYPEPFHDLRPMGLDRLATEVEHTCDLLCILAFSDQL